MSRYIVKAMYLEKSKCLIIWNRGSSNIENQQSNTSRRINKRLIDCYPKFHIKGPHCMVRPYENLASKQGKGRQNTHGYYLVDAYN